MPSPQSAALSFTWLVYAFATNVRAQVQSCDGLFGSEACFVSASDLASGCSTQTTGFCSVGFGTHACFSGQTVDGTGTACVAAGCACVVGICVESTYNAVCPTTFGDPDTPVCGDDVVCDDPHMQGLRGQRIDWAGVNGGWYSLIGDPQADLHINIRLTAPLPNDFANRQLISGVSIMSGGHSLAIEVKNPYTVATEGCPKGVSPCLANGGLRAIVDGEKVENMLQFSRDVNVADDMIWMSASNLPVECRQFGGDKIWASMYDEMLKGERVLTDAKSFEDWILSFHNMAAPEWCTKYIAENDLTHLQSTHAIFKIETSAITVRLNAGVNHQGGGELDWDGRVLPDLEFWQMDVGLDGLDIDSPTLSGILGETSRPVYDGNGRAVMEGLEAIRGDVEDYRVAGSLGTHFALLEKTDGGL